MKKFLTFLSSVMFLTGTTLSTAACGVSPGSEIKINFDGPIEAKNGADPTKEYVFNEKYSFNSSLPKITIATAGQLVADDIRSHPEKFNGELWKEFYNSDEWKYGSFSSFNYELPKDYAEKAFAFGGNGGDFISFVKNDDPSKDDNKIRSYWFITSANPWAPGEEQNYQPKKDNITIPKITDFTDDKKVIPVTGWVHFYLVIGQFKIDFNALLTFNFIKFVNKDNSFVMLDKTTFAEPFGDLLDPKTKKYDPNKVAEATNKFIKGIYISKNQVS